MAPDTETELWAWLLFDAGIKTYTAKQLFTLLQDKNISLQELRQMPHSEMTAKGFGSYQSTLSQNPIRKESISAIRWNAPLYPQGLHDLDIKYKPALLFFNGDLDLLARPIIYLLPGETTPPTAELLAGVVELLLDGSLLPAAFTGSPQERILIDQMMVNDGEALIFIDRGMDRWTPSEEIAQNINAGRIIALSPMPPGTAASPALNPIIQRIGAAAANRWVISSNLEKRAPADGLSRSTLHLLPDNVPGTPQLPAVRTAGDIEEAIHWINNSFIPDEEQTAGQTEVPVEEKLPPLSSASALQILEQGGTVPEVLRQRLLDAISKKDLPNS
ncbi:MAG: hypothetical protein E4H27_02400 [Anaerolineales bacterium]|nr:MAG: hypothetical protein E4H27_02400 [Anaerolineales bacterium]